MRVVQDCSAETIRDLLQEHIEPGSIVYTDCWKGYSKRDLEELGFEHGTVNHSKHFRDPVTEIHTNTIEGTWNGIKVRVSPRHRTVKHVGGHLMAFC